MPTLVPRDLLELDYQQLRVDLDYTTIGWIYSISDCDISHFTLEGFELDDVFTNSLQEPTLVHNSTTNIVTIPLNNVSGLHFRLSALGTNRSDGEVCEIIILSPTRYICIIFIFVITGIHCRNT